MTYGNAQSAANSAVVAESIVWNAARTWGKGVEMSKQIETAKITVGIVDLIEELNKSQTKTDRQLKVLKREQWKKRSRRR